MILVVIIIGKFLARLNRLLTYVYQYYKNVLLKSFFLFLLVLWANPGVKNHSFLASFRQPSTDTSIVL